MKTLEVQHGWDWLRAKESQEAGYLSPHAFLPQLTRRGGSKGAILLSLPNNAEASTLQLSFYTSGCGEPPPAFLLCSSSVKLTISVVNNQLSGAWRVSLNLIDYLFELSSYLPLFNSALLGKRVKVRARLELIVDDFATNLQ